MAILQGFGYALDKSMVTMLPERHSDKDMLDLMDEEDKKIYKAVQANDNAMAWLRMAFPLPKHQHEIDVACTPE